MPVMTNRSGIQVVRPEDQATGAFDGGRITEIKPIGFPGEGGSVDRVGPLFYWAWATAEDYGKIGMHPHQGFEILSYVLNGELGHHDSLGTRSRVGAGGVQVIQAGSGVSHEEEILGQHTEFFQIWFEPNLRESVKQPARYHEFQANAFMVEHNDGVRRRALIGRAAPLQLSTDVELEHVRLDAGAMFEISPTVGRRLAIVVMRGEGVVRTAEESDYVAARDFVVADSIGVTLSNTTDETFEVMVADVPASVDYELYDKRRR